MQYFSKMEDVPEKYKEHLDQMRWSDGRVPTDKEKLEALNSLSGVLENIMDRWFGTGQYASPKFDAEAFRKSEIERHAKEDRMTPQEFYDEAYADFMNRFGKSNIKRFGAEATEEKARAWAASSMKRAIETRQLWYDQKAKMDTEKSEKQKTEKRRKKAVPAA